MVTKASIEAIEAIATTIRAVGASIDAAEAAIEAAISLLLTILTWLKGGRATQRRKSNEVEESCLEEPSSIALGNGRSRETWGRRPGLEGSAEVSQKIYHVERLWHGD